MYGCPMSVIEHGRLLTVLQGQVSAYLTEHNAFGAMSAVTLE